MDVWDRSALGEVFGFKRSLFVGFLTIVTSGRENSVTNNHAADQLDSGFEFEWAYHPGRPSFGEECESDDSK